MLAQIWNELFKIEFKRDHELWIQENTSRVQARLNKVKGLFLMMLNGFLYSLT